MGINFQSQNVIENAETFSGDYEDMQATLREMYEVDEDTLITGIDLDKSAQELDDPSAEWEDDLY